MNPAIFREYDIRGVAQRDLESDVVYAIGKAFATMIQRDGPGGSDRPVIAVGRDCRLASPRLFEALTRGIVETGVDFLDIGVVATPVLYFAAAHFATAGAVIITGSHNPPEDNGFKLLRGTASLHGQAIQELRRIIEQADYSSSASPGTSTTRDAIAPYLDHAESTLRLGERRMRVVVDAGNGAGGPPAVALYRRLGFDVVDLYCAMDGRFPNHHPDPTVAENLADLQQRVHDEDAELGIALDGDADRIGVIDSRGNILWGDQLMILFGRAILAESPGATFIAEVKCSQALYDELARAGGHPIMWKVGHSLIKAKMKQENALLAGEMSGHIFFAHRYLGFDDGIYAGARLLEILSRGPKTLAELYDTLPVMVNTPELRVPCADEDKLAVVTRAVASLRRHPEVTGVIDVDGARASFGDGWGLIRASNTQPILVLRCEARNHERLQQIRAIIEAAIASARRESMADDDKEPT